MAFRSASTDASSRSVAADRNVIFKFQTSLQSKFIYYHFFSGGAMNNIFHNVAINLYRTRSIGREENNLNKFLKTPTDKWPENAFEVSQLSFSSVGRGGSVVRLHD